MEQVLKNIVFSILIAIFFFCIARIWEWKSNGSIPSKVASLVATSSIFLLTILQFVLEVVSGKDSLFTAIIMVTYGLLTGSSAISLLKATKQENKQEEDDEQSER